MAASSSSGLRSKYDVFINFRGEDTRRGFVSHLYRALHQKQIKTFIDAEKLRKGDSLSELLTAIRQSRLSIVVLSQNYASSTWCLKELVQILECMDTMNQIVVPIFYDVNPSDIRKLEGSFAKAFAKHERHSNVDVKEVQNWKSALARATDLSDWNSEISMDDAKLIEEIVEDVIGRLIPISSTPSKDDGLECTGSDRLMASSSSSPALRWKYDVFINFRGEDTRRGFVSNLYRALRQRAIMTFIDTEELRAGEPISELLTVIRESRLSIVVFSQNYASSTWCLKELVQILECKDTKNQIVVPIFYDVNPSDVRKLEGSFAKAFAKHEHERHSNDDVKEVQSWRSALARATNLSGWDSRSYRDVAKLVEEIVEDALGKLIHISSTSSKDNGLVEMDSHMHEMDSHMHEMDLLLHPLGVETNGFRIVGIWGMGGLGKTTIAKAVFSEIAYRFDDYCFLENVQEGFRKHGVLHMQTQILSSISKNKVRSFDISRIGFEVMLKSLGSKNVLLVVDDVDNLAQIEALLGKQHSFGAGSKIIITTRDVQLLSIADAIYRPKFLSDIGALELFRRYAFRKNQPTRDYDALSSRAVKYAQGLPLALKVLGAFLYSRTVREWEYALVEKRTFCHWQRAIHDVLRISFNGLGDTEKDIFLDIACFFKGMEKDYATKILDSCGFCPHSGIRVLIDRALLTLPYGGSGTGDA